MTVFTRLNFVTTIETWRRVTVFLLTVLLFPISKGEDVHWQKELVLGQRYVLGKDFLDGNKTGKWYFNGKAISPKEPGPNFRIRDDGQLVILNMTLSLKGVYKLMVGNKSVLFHVHVRADVIDVKQTYNETIIAGVVHQQWYVMYKMSTRKKSDCPMAANIKLCSKPSDESECEDLAAAIIGKAGVCAIKIIHNTTASNTTVKCYVKFTRSNAHSREQTFLLKTTPDPFPKQNETNPITNPQALNLNSTTASTAPPTTPHPIHVITPSKTSTMSISSSVKIQTTQKPTTDKTKAPPTTPHPVHVITPSKTTTMSISSSVKIQTTQKPTTDKTMPDWMVAVIVAVIIVIIGIIIIVICCVRRRRQIKYYMSVEKGGQTSKQIEMLTPNGED